VTETQRLLLNDIENITRAMCAAGCAGNEIAIAQLGELLKEKQDLLAKTI
jgi:hypothetical protein